MRGRWTLPGLLLALAVLGPRATAEAQEPEALRAEALRLEAELRDEVRRASPAADAVGRSLDPRRRAALVGVASAVACGDEAGAERALVAYVREERPPPDDVTALLHFILRATVQEAADHLRFHREKLEAMNAASAAISEQLAVDAYPETILLVDTYDTLKGVENVIALARELGDGFQVRGVRLDSGDLGDLAVQTRRMLDDAGLGQVEIFASGGLTEYEISLLLRRGAPIDAFGVGTGMGVSSDAPALDTAFKLAQYAGRGRLKTSPGKPILPGRKQIFRVEERGRDVQDVVARWNEKLPGRPLLRQVMRGGERLPEGDESLDAARERARHELERLPDHIRSIEQPHAAFPVQVSPVLTAYQNEVIARLKNTAGGPAQPPQEEDR